MKKKEMLESRGFRDEKHLKSWLEECTDKTLVKEVKEYFEISDELDVVEVKEVEKPKRGKGNTKKEVKVKVEK